MKAIQYKIQTRKKWFQWFLTITYPLYKIKWQSISKIKYSIDTENDCMIASDTINCVCVCVGAVGGVIVQLLSHVQLFGDPMGCSPPGFSVHGISQARILKGVAISFSSGSFGPTDWTCISCIGRKIPYWGATRKVLCVCVTMWVTIWYWMTQLYY